MEVLTVIILVVMIAFFHAAIWAAILACWAFSLGLLALAWLHPWKVLVYGAGYFLLGAVWSLIRWYLYVTEQVNEWRESGQKDFSYRKSLCHPSRHKEDFFVWIAFWPLNGIWVIVDDPLTRLCKRIYHELFNTYQHISDHAWSKVK